MAQYLRISDKSLPIIADHLREQAGTTVGNPTDVVAALITYAAPGSGCSPFTQQDWLRDQVSLTPLT
jgi:hypothetical protein